MIAFEMMVDYLSTACWARRVTKYGSLAVKTLVLALCAAAIGCNPGPTAWK